MFVFFKTWVLFMAVHILDVVVQNKLQSARESCQGQWWVKLLSNEDFNPALMKKSERELWWCNVDLAFREHFMALDQNWLIH